MPEERAMPIGAQDFQDLREKGFVYVDKTQYVSKLVNSSKVYFLSRPRRFGKSLFLSTLAAYFQGQKELFKGLYLEKTEEEFAHHEGREAWIEYPVLYLDFNAKNFESRKALIERLTLNLEKWEKTYGTTVQTESPEERFANIIQQAYKKTGRQVVVLIDEYDKPLLDTINKPELNETYRDILKAFFAVIKSSDQYLRFAFLTGVTKFSKVSVFSGLNNLRDLSLLSDFAGICGITEAELSANFTPEIEALATRQRLTITEAYATLRKWYDGYRFAREGESVYNPFSLLNVFASRELSDYWYATGTPTFLVEYLKEAHYNIPELDDKVRLDEAGMDTYRADSQNPLPILYQAGYLTIKEYIASRKVYRLGFPNAEVRYGFMKNLLDGFAPSLYGAGVAVSYFVDDVEAGNVESFMRRMQSILAGIPYNTVTSKDAKLYERDFQVSVYLIFSLMGEFVETEVHNNVGRADAVVRTQETIYVFEFKLWSSGTPADALAQIKTNGYAKPYLSSGKSIILIGASFDEATRNLAAWETEVFK